MFSKTLSVSRLLMTRSFYSSTVVKNVSIFDFEKVYNLSKRPTGDKSTVLIDVREPDEFKQGAIETSYNLPVGKIEEAMKLSDEEFSKTYGFSKPVFEDNVVVYCRSGRRSTTASDILTKLGYKNIGNYTGSWLEWSDKIKSK
ncbi:putative thiosulfate sulfurtransferase, mitochondrial [Schizosaccharomyces pombe]|uniref:Putative thiosulfate sulfurtransferase, mitochondrial n=1 Tax=Schizosaccharomyces pombe (strain 972 / ATCC 24843) TaxID=284812 RepID=RDL_SCHPO|nr:putative protein phosphatase Fmp31 [Schizosaccharomyces pombe]Q10215.2 RecName: Full=Putative thiosulfate sulfurtransferase, mitochondrial; AltName: Full=Rhodanese-like protein; Flags: Precursor [Schizosaccharomyces pombe 972h-]CAA93346.2 protein phosphatase Fmp31 (predicted) [Schizosaccharomyces pombe]|eukprot:NP_594343.2 putative protein phosphatase Fmp31 [Schizosaccharomyces pombe]